MYSRSDFPTMCGGSWNQDNSGQLLVDGTPRPYRDPDGAPWWAEYDVANLYHDFDADLGTKWAATFGNDYLAGGEGNDLVFGELGDDVIQATAASTAC